MPTTFGFVMQIAFGTFFLGLAGISWWRGRHCSGGHRSVGIAIDVVLAVASFADAASSSTSGALRQSLWGVATVALLGGIGMLVFRDGSALRSLGRGTTPSDSRKGGPTDSGGKTFVGGSRHR